MSAMATGLTTGGAVVVNIAAPVSAAPKVWEWKQIKASHWAEFWGKETDIKKRRAMWRVAFREASKKGIWAFKSGECVKFDAKLLRALARWFLAGKDWDSFCVEAEKTSWKTFGFVHLILAKTHGAQHGRVHHNKQAQHHGKAGQMHGKDHKEDDDEDDEDEKHGKAGQKHGKAGQKHGKGQKDDDCDDDDKDDKMTKEERQKKREAHLAKIKKLREEREREHDQDKKEREAEREKRQKEHAQDKKEREAEREKKQKEREQDKAEREREREKRQKEHEKTHVLPKVDIVVGDSQ